MLSLSRSAQETQRLDLSVYTPGSTGWESYALYPNADAQVCTATPSCTLTQL